MPSNNLFEESVKKNILTIRDTIGKMTGLGDYVGIEIIDASGALAADPLSQVSYFPDLDDHNLAFSDSLKSDLCSYVADVCIGARLGGIYKLKDPIASCPNPCSCSRGGHPCMCCPCP